MDENLTLRLGDVGISKYTRLMVADVDSVRQSRMELVTLNVPYAAPEVLRFGRVSEASETFSIGVILYEIFAESKVYRDKTAGEVEKEILAGRRCKIPSDVDQGIRNLINMCWSQSNADRPHLYVRRSADPVVYKVTISRRNQIPNHTNYNSFP
jgi:hypothetical protein